MNRISTFCSHLKNIFFLKDDDIQVSAFNILAFSGIVVCLISAAYNLLNGLDSASLAGILSGALFALGMMIFTLRTGHYYIAMVLTVVVVFFGLFTFLFFTSGGYHSGMPSYFIFGVVFTAFMLDGMTMSFFIVAELMWYAVICAYAYKTAIPLGRMGSEAAYLTDVIVSETLVASILAITMYLQIQLYRKKQEELHRATQAAEEANRLKSDFLAKMSHDIRTPLNTIMGMNELILRHSSSPEIRECADDSRKAGQVLLSMINDMLDLSRIEAGMMELNPHPYSPQQLIGEMKKLWELHSSGSGLSFEACVEGDVPRGLVGDETAIRKIINNLLGNSFKYTRKGKVSLRLSFQNEPFCPEGDDSAGSFREPSSEIPACASDGANAPGADATVANVSGADVVRANAPGADAVRANAPGTNAAVANASGVNAARVEAPGAPGANVARLEVLVANAPRADAVVANAPEGDAGGGVGTGWLVISVRDTGIGIEEKYLEKIFLPFERLPQGKYGDMGGSGLGLAIVKEITDAMGGTVHCWSRVNEGTVFTVSIPQGIITEEKLCSPGPAANVQSASDEDSVHAIESGADALSVPEASLGSRLNGRLRGDGQIAAPGARILLVDDNYYNRKVIVQLLEPTLVFMDDVESGYEAMEMIDIREYDLILMDLRMAGMDGTETLERIREEYPDFKTPVIALTADIMPGVRDRLLKQGFADFIPKPVNSARLYEMLRSFLPGKLIMIDRGQDAGFSQDEIAAWQDRLLPYGINFNLGLECNAGNAAEFVMRASLFNAYASDGQRRLSKCREGPDEEYYLQAHSAKSAARGIGAWIMADLAEAVEYRHDHEYSIEANPVLLYEYRRVQAGLALFLNDIKETLM